MKEMDPKRVYYLSMEFLMGRSLLNALYNLDIKDQVGPGAVLGCWEGQGGGADGEGERGPGEGAQAVASAHSQESGVQSASVHAATHVVKH